VIARLRANEPVRLFGYPAVAAVVLYLVGRGVVDAELGNLIVAGVALVLGAAGTEYTRRQVTPPDHLGDVIADGAERLLDGVEEQAAQWYGEAGTAVLRQIRERVAELRDTGVSGGRHRADQ
jgi:hypothetical protein